jgi:adenylate cyclase
MPEGQTNRRLAAILAADVVGYSRLMAANETGTLTALKQFRENLFNPAIASHNGRIVKLIGDGTLVEFASVVDAVECAVAVQNTVSTRMIPSGEPAIQLRIGVNLGDVIIDGDDIYGDGVNVAARLEPLADPGGVCISSIVHEGVGNRIDSAFRSFGQVNVKNIDRPISIWKWRPGEAPATAPAATPKREAARAAPSIAVLPFDNMSGDPSREYFSDGVAEDIITDLAKVAGLIVIARNSSFAYKGKKFDIRDIARELNVGFVLEGSIRHAANRVRVTAQLIDASNGAHLWAERYDRDLTDIFAVQDDVTQQIVAALKVTLSPAEKARLSDSGATNIDAHDCFMRGRELLVNATQTLETFEQAVAQMKRAIELDPNYAKAFAGLAWAYVLDYTNQWSEDADRSLALARRCADQAVEKDPREPLAHFSSAMVAGRERDTERAVAEANATLALSPHFSPARGLLGSVELYAGRPLAAITHMEQSMRLDPVVSQQGLHFLGLAYLMAGKYETAAAIFKQRLVLAPNSDTSRSFLASALGHIGEIEEARRVWDELKAINPKYSFARHVSRLPFQREEDIKIIAQGLTKAGLATD